MSKATTAERALNRKGGTMSRLIKTLFGFYPVLLPLVVAGVVLCAIINSIGATFLQSALQIISESWQSGDWGAAQPEIAQLVTTLACIYGIGILSSLFWNRAMAIVTQGSLEKLREKMFNRMQDLPIRYFDTHQRGDIMSHYTNDIDTLRQMISQSLPNLLMTVIVIVTVFFIMLYYSVWMCLVIIAGVAFMTFMTKLLGSNSARFFIAQQTELGVVEGHIEEVMNGQKVVKAFCHESAAEADFDERNEKLFEVSQKANMYANILMPILMNLGNLLYVLVALAGGIFLALGVPNLSISGMALSIAVVVPFLNMTKQFCGQIGQISQQINAVVMGLAGADRIFELIDEEPEADEGYVTLVNAQVNPDTWQLEEADHHTGMWAWKHPHRATGEIELRAAARRPASWTTWTLATRPTTRCCTTCPCLPSPGQKVAFVGATGAGKTTITNLINRFYDIADGKIRYDGINVNKIRKADLRRSPGRRAAGREPVHRHRDGQHPLRQPGRHRRGVHRGGQARGRGRLHHPPARRLRHHAHRQRRAAVAGPAPADLDRTRRRRRSAGDDPGRGHVEHRYPHRGHRASRHGQAHGGPHDVRHRAPPVHRAQLRRDHLSGSRPHHRARQPRRADRQARVLLPALYRSV